MEILCHLWISQYVVIEDRIQLRDPNDMPPAAQQLESPYELEARCGEKRGMDWIGYTAHLTETCDDDLPHLLTQVETTIATQADIEQLNSIQEGLARVDLLPAQHVVDAEYVRARSLVTSRTEHQIDLVGPVPEAPTWQAKAKQGYALEAFQVDWEARHVRCPQGRISACWSATGSMESLAPRRAARRSLPWLLPLDSPRQFANGISVGHGPGNGMPTCPCGRSLTSTSWYLRTRSDMLVNCCCRLDTVACLVGSAASCATSALSRQTVQRRTTSPDYPTDAASTTELPRSLLVLDHGVGGAFAHSYSRSRGHFCAHVSILSITFSLSGACKSDTVVIFRATSRRARSTGNVLKTERTTWA